MATQRRKGDQKAYILLPFAILMLNLIEAIKGRLMLSPTIFGGVTYDLIPLSMEGVWPTSLLSTTE